MQVRKRAGQKPSGFVCGDRRDANMQTARTKVRLKVTRLRFSLSSYLPVNMASPDTKLPGPNVTPPELTRPCQGNQMCWVQMCWVTTSTTTGG